jgi:hypothetical protein
MEAIRTIWSFALLFGALAFTQLLGVLLFFRLRRHQHFLAHFSGFVLPILLSAAFCWMVYIFRYYRLHPDDRDGGQLLGALMIIMLAVGGQVLIGLLTQVTLHAKVHSCSALR